MWLFRVILYLLFTNIIKPASTKGIPGLSKPNAGASLTSKDTCDQLAENFCFYTLNYTNIWVNSSITGQNCQDYGHDDVRFNITKGLLGTKTRNPVKKRVWTVSKLTHLDSPESVISLKTDGGDGVPKLKWLKKSYTLTELVWLDAKDLKNFVLFGGSDKFPFVDRTRIPC